MDETLELDKQDKKEIAEAVTRDRPLPELMDLIAKLKSKTDPAINRFNWNKK